MSMAMKCDICGNFFDDRTVSGYIAYHTIGLSYAGLSCDGRHRCVYQEDTYHLCPKCTEKIKEVLNIKRQNMEEAKR